MAEMAAMASCHPLPVSSDNSSSPSGYISHRYADEYWGETVLARHQVSQSFSNKSDLTPITTHLFHSKSNNQTVSYAIMYSAAGHTQGSILNLSILRYLHVLRRLEDESAGIQSIACLWSTLKCPYFRTSGWPLLCCAWLCSKHFWLILLV